MFEMEIGMEAIVKFIAQLSVILIIGAGLIGFTVKKLIQLIKG